MAKPPNRPDPPGFFLVAGPIAPPRRHGRGRTIGARSHSPTGPLIGFATVSYAWLKALHIIFIVSWFAGLFYIFRLYVYHIENRDKPDVVAVLEVMERKLYRAICWPAMVLTTAFGLWLWSRQFTGYLQATWFQIKLVGLVGLFGYHFYSGKVRKDLAAGRYELTSRQCRLINETPTILLFLIVTMAVVKPFSG